MAYLVLARKYRPQKFSELIGQETVAKILQAAILKDRVATAYLFSGTRGTGKTTSARLFAKALNCKKPKGGEPCNECSSCKEVTGGSSMDVLEIDAASHTGVDNMREVVINTVGFSPARDRFKVFIIDEVHMLSNQSFNALLKTLEEPPAHVVFILCTTEYHKIPATIASRCQRFRFLPLTQKEIFSNITTIAAQEKISIDEDALVLLARSAGGSMRDALSLLDQTMSQMSPDGDKKTVTKITLARVEEVLGVVKEDLLIQFIQNVAEKNSKGVLSCIDRVLKDGYDLSYFLKEVRETFRRMLIEKCGFTDEDTFVKTRSNLPVDRFSTHQLLRASQILTKCSEQMRWSDLPRIVFECYAVWLCQESLSAQEVFDKLEGLKAGAPVPAKNFSTPPPAPVFKEEVSRYAEPKKEVPAPVVVAEDPAPVPAPAEKSGETPSADLRQVWSSLLVQVQREKPSLMRALEAATPALFGNRLELSFSTAFLQESAKRSIPWIEKTLKDVIKKDLSVGTKLVPAAPKPPVSQDAGDTGRSGGNETWTVVGTEEDAASFALAEASKDAETFEVVGDASDPATFEDLKSIEDPGLKSFLKTFSGEVIKPEP